LQLPSKESNMGKKKKKTFVEHMLKEATPRGRQCQGCPLRRTLRWRLPAAPHAAALLVLPLGKLTAPPSGAQQNQGMSTHSKKQQNILAPTLAAVQAPVQPPFSTQEQRDNPSATSLNSIANQQPHPLDSNQDRNSNFIQRKHSRRGSRGLG